MQGGRGGREGGRRGREGGREDVVRREWGGMREGGREGLGVRGTKKIRMERRRVVRLKRERDREGGTKGGRK